MQYIVKNRESGVIGIFLALAISGSILTVGYMVDEGRKSTLTLAERFKIQDAADTANRTALSAIAELYVKGVISVTPNNAEGSGTESDSSNGAAGGNEDELDDQFLWETTSTGVNFWEIVDGAVRVQSCNTASLASEIDQIMVENWSVEKCGSNDTAGDSSSKTLTTRIMMEELRSDSATLVARTVVHDKNGKKIEAKQRMKLDFSGSSDCTIMNPSQGQFVTVDTHKWDHGLRDPADGRRKSTVYLAPKLREAIFAETPPEQRYDTYNGSYNDATDTYVFKFDIFHWWGREYIHGFTIDNHNFPREIWPNKDLPT